MATIDSRIALGVQPTVQLESPANSLAKMLQLQGLQQQNEAARYDMDLKRHDAEQTNRLRTFLASGIDLDTQEGRNALYRAAPTKADAIIKSRVDTRKAIIDAEKSAFEISQNRYKAYKQTLGALYNAPNLSKDMVMSAGQEMVALGVITPELYQRAVAGLPDDVAALRQQLQQGLAAQLTPEQVFTVFSAKPTAVDDGQNISYRDLNPNSPTFGQNVGGPSVKKQQSPDSVASNETTRRGQNMVDARARETLEFNRSQPRGQFLQTEQGYVLADPRTGVVQPVMGADGKPLQGKSATKNLTEGQAKANLFGSRMVEADRILNELGDKYDPLSINLKSGLDKLPGPGLFTAGVNKWALSENDQKADQAQRDFINAVLRRESGAVIADSEFDNARKQYFPQPGDSPEVLKQKARNRRTAINGMAAEIPGGLRSVPTAANPGGAVSPGGFKILSVE